MTAAEVTRRAPPVVAVLCRRLGGLGELAAGDFLPTPPPSVDRMRLGSTGTFLCGARGAPGANDERAKGAQDWLAGASTAAPRTPSERALPGSPTSVDN